MPPQQRILAVLERYPGGVLVETMLVEVGAATRASVREDPVFHCAAWADAGLVNVAGKRSKTAIVTAMVTLSLPMRDTAAKYSSAAARVPDCYPTSQTGGTGGTRRSDLPATSAILLRI